MRWIFVIDHDAAGQGLGGKADTPEEKLLFVC